MAINIYQSSVPVFLQILGSLSSVLTKTAAFAEAKKIDPSVLVAARLAPDMYPLARQIQIATDHAKGASARLAGVDVPSFPDTEATIPELQQRIQKTVDFIKGLKPAQFEGAEDRDVTLTIAGQKITWKGATYLFHFAFPNFYFHATTAYDILRHNGLDVGKRDFIGSF
jgi:hypothetical protein